MKNGVVSSLYFDNYNVGTDTFLCEQNKAWQILTIVMCIGVHNQDKPLPPGTIQQ